MLPTFSFEQLLWKKGSSLVIGVDEVGRGALAGPVVAGAAAVKVWSMKNGVSGIRKNINIQNTPYKILDTILSLSIDDSKRLSARQRETLVPHIEHYFYCATGEASVAEINRYGIVSATQKAMRRAIRNLVCSMQYFVSGIKKNGTMQNTKNVSFLLIDGKFSLPYCLGLPITRQQAIIKGDQQSISIAAASIIAKVYRDDLMQRLAREYPNHEWQTNKGYGTKRHLQAIQERGITSMHRQGFVSGMF